jgi:ABC-type amino acid transport substrate-binding protein
MLWGTFKYAFAAPVGGACTRRFEVGVADYVPIFYREDGKAKGIGHEFARELERRTGCSFVETEYARPAAISQMKLGRLDLFFFSASLFEFESIGSFVPIFETKRSLTVLNSIQDKHQNIEDYIKDKSIKFGVVIGSQSSFTKGEYDLLISQERTIGVPSPDGLFRLIKTKRVQAVMFPSITTKYFVKINKLENLTKELEDPKNKSLVGYIYSNRRMSKSDLALVQDALKEMKADGTMDKLLTIPNHPRDTTSEVK